MNALSIVAGLIFVVVLLAGLGYTMYKSHLMVIGKYRSKKGMGKNRVKPT